SLDAVLYPADTDHLFFVACYDGTHEFNYTLEDHEQDRDTICAASRG
ncbi:MAG: endolytic transglycosylase MltG, partial [Prochlorotrichaceae cyanobacterium]